MLAAGEGHICAEARLVAGDVEGGLVAAPPPLQDSVHQGRLRRGKSAFGALRRGAMMPRPPPARLAARRPVGGRAMGAARAAAARHRPTLRPRARTPRRGAVHWRSMTDVRVIALVLGALRRCGSEPEIVVRGGAASGGKPRCPTKLGAEGSPRLFALCGFYTRLTNSLPSAMSRFNRGGIALKADQSLKRADELVGVSRGPARAACIWMHHCSDHPRFQGPPAASAPPRRRRRDGCRRQGAPACPAGRF